MPGVVTRGIPEAVKALESLQRGLGKVLTDELKEAAEPVAATVRHKLSEKIPNTKTNRIRVVSLRRRVLVRQTAKKTTGKRPDFGKTQMVYGFEPALEEHADELVGRVEAALERASSQHGF